MTAKDCNLGDVVKDNITGLTGVVVARTEWLNGCWRIVVQPKEIKDGKPVDPSTFDVEQLELVQSLKAKAKQVRTGGDRPDAVGWAANTRPST